MEINEKNIQINIPIDLLVQQISEKIIKKMDANPTVKEEEITVSQLLTRKQAYTELGVTPPTFDSYVEDGIITNVGGKGKRARFRREDVTNAYENMNKILYQRRNNRTQKYHKACN